MNVLRFMIMPNSTIEISNWTISVELWLHFAYLERVEC